MGPIRFPLNQYWMLQKNCLLQTEIGSCLFRSHWISFVSINRSCLTLLESPLIFLRITLFIPLFPSAKYMMRVGQYWSVRSWNSKGNLIPIFMAGQCRLFWRTDYIVKIFCTFYCSQLQPSCFELDPWKYVQNDLQSQTRGNQTSLEATVVV